MELKPRKAGEEEAKKKPFNWTNVELKRLIAADVMIVEYTFNWTNVELKQWTAFAKWTAFKYF